MGNAYEQQARLPRQQSLKSKKVDFKLHIAIDFGTNGCALAFAYNNEVIVYNKWKVKKRQRTLKVKTQILLNDKDEMVAFGDNATKIYSNLTGNEKHTWKLFDRFKMSLYGRYCDQLRTINDLTCDASIVFIETFRYLQNIAIEYITKVTQQTFEPEDIQFILTVPAIWSERAKNNMKSWIIAAGLVNESIIDQCLIVYEPDCAALAIREEMKQKQKDAVMHSYDHKEDTAPDIALNDVSDAAEQMQFQIGDKYILIDAGGGTVDIVCHEVVDNDCVQEIHYPSGGLWGGDLLNIKYITLLNAIFGEDLMNKFKKTYTNTYTDIICNFEDSTISFFEDESASAHDVDLPFEFIQYLNEECDVNASVNKFNKEKSMQTDDSKDMETIIDIKDDRMIIALWFWRFMFDSMIDKIVTHLKLLTHELKNECKYLYLVGGIACSKYFQTRMIGIFHKHIKVCVPETPMLMVVKGCAYFGIRPNYVRARTLKYTYGVKARYSFEEATERGIPKAHLQDPNNMFSDGNNVTVVENCFCIVAKKGNSVSMNHCFTKKFIMTSSSLQLQILRSDLMDPKVVNDGVIAGIIQFDRYYGYNDKIVTEFHFHGTMLKIKAYREHDPYDRHIMKVQYR